MAAVVVTSFSASGAALYGRRGVAAFVRHSQLPMVVYLDTPPCDLPRVEMRLTSDIVGWPEVRARLPMRRPEASKPDRYTWHARRFGVKPFVWLDAARRLGSGVLMWLDGDTRAIAPVPNTLPESLLGDADVAYLGRASQHPETGYVGFRVPQALPLIQWCRDAYATGAFAALDGWTDCHVLRAGLRMVPVRARDLTTAHYVGRSHIWPVSPLAPYFAHDKGVRAKAVAAC